MSLACRIRTKFARPEAGVVARLGKLPVAVICDVMGRTTGSDARLRPMHREGALAGPALTVRCKPGDNLLLQKAIDVAAPGDVIVVDGGGNVQNALMGELMLSHAIRRGIAGFVIDGAVRDIAFINQINLPLYAVGVTPRGPFREGPGEIGFAVSVDGMVVEPGDILVGDADGVVAVPRLRADAVLAQAEEKAALEERQRDAIAGGRFDRSWIDPLLNKIGAEYVD